MSLVLTENREVKNVAQETSVQVARLDERIGQVQEITAELRVAVFGNGKPGIKNEMDELRRRLEEIEAAHEEEKGERKAERAERRKYKWGLLAAGTTLLLDLLLRYFHLSTP